MSQTALAQVLRDLAQFEDPNLLVGSATSDDAMVYRIDAERALVQTVDFFTPVVNDPYFYGQIAAANALSDIYAMGGRPLTAMNIVGMPVDLVSEEIIHRILMGGADKAKEACCVLAGGHSIKSPEPIYGLSVTGMVHPNRILTNAGARPGDLLVLTKPLGTGILTTGIKRGLVGGELVERTIRLMCLLNSPGTILGERELVRCATDVTGFGLLGHLRSMCFASKVSAEISSVDVPLVDREVVRLVEQEACVPGGTRENLDIVDPFVDWAGSVNQATRFILTDAQTSGGLLCCVAEDRLADVMTVLEQEQSAVRVVIGRILPADSSPERLIRVK